MTDLTSTLPRRQFLRGQFLKTLQTEQVKQQGFQVIRPPWADLANFSQKCTACSRCIDVCEMHILVKGESGYPEVDFTQGRKECSFCQACVNVCEEAVFRPTTESPWEHKVAIQENCLAKKNVECRSCQDSCEGRAIRFHRQLGKSPMPEVNLNSCNGCGACISVCPTHAIVVMHNE
ncbi:ferredoxin-type protein NapF [Pasteurellaceae bacterium Macca]|nr:ferredoxin-type protein NapF [Pasteurellaceae bacterium Macca]